MPFNYSQFVGTKYDQADCWELVTLVCHVLQRELPCLAGPELVEALDSWVDVQTPQAGDVVLFQIDGIVYHCGIAVSDRQFLHAVEAPTGAVIEPLFDGYWDLKLAGIKRYVK